MKNYIIKTLNGMSYGLFATLIVGVIFQQVGLLFNIKLLSHDLYNLLAGLMGVGIALGIGIVLKKDGLTLVMIAIVGAISTRFLTSFNPFQINTTTGPGNPLTAYFVTIFTILLLERLLVKKTPVDIIIVPIIYIVTALVFTIALSFPLNFLTDLIKNGIEAATNFMPVVMVIVISVSMGMVLTSPISSAAISFAIGLSGIAAGAAVVGTSIQMIGFAIQSRRDNGIGKVLSVAFGTSMLQFKNIIRKPVIWLPTILSSAIVAPLVYLLNFTSTAAGAGMGTSGLVGIFQSLQNMNYSIESFISIAIIIIIGGLFVYLFDKILYVKGYIKDGDLSLSDDL